jgi:hypothetical protein
VSRESVVRIGSARSTERDRWRAHAFSGPESAGGKVRPARFTHRSVMPTTLVLACPHARGPVAWSVGLPCMVSRPASFTGAARCLADGTPHVGPSALSGSNPGASTSYESATVGAPQSTRVGGSPATLESLPSGVPLLAHAAREPVECFGLGTDLPVEPATRANRRRTSNRQRPDGARGDSPERRAPFTHGSVSPANRRAPWSGEDHITGTPRDPKYPPGEQDSEASSATPAGPSLVSAGAGFFFRRAA